MEQAEPVVKRIVKELTLSKEKRTIQPIDIGGVAGGDK